MATRFLLQHATLDTQSMVAVRFLFAAAAMLPVALRGIPLHAAGPWRVGAIVLCSGAGFSLLNTGGLNYAPAAHAAALTAPLGGVLTGIGAHWLLGEHLSRRATIGLVVITVGAIGIVLATIIESGQGGARMLIGHAHFLGAGLCWAAYVVAARDSGFTAMQTTAVAVIGSAIIYSLPWLVFAGEAIRAAPWSEIVIQGTVHGLIAATFSIVLFNISVFRLGAARSGAATALSPVLGAVMALVVLHEVAGPLQWVGYATVAIGVWLAASRGSPARGLVAPRRAGG